MHVSTVRTLALAGSLFTAALLAPRVHAGTITIDSTTSGAVYDSLIDGFPIGPVAKDGVADLSGNALAIALKGSVTEERGIAELPLAPLAGLTADDVVSATLTFNFDDVLSTFGPGTDFDNTAADTVMVFGYEGDGTIALADFGNVAGAPLGTVDTTPRGIITDATLGVTGPEVFTIDVTARLKTLLGGSATHFGFVFTTDDDQTGTSLDDLGLGSGGPAGVGGARLPFLTITTPPEPATEPPVLGKAALKCQKAIAKQTQAYGVAIRKLTSKCFDGILTAVAKGKPVSGEQAKCAAAIDTASPSSKLAAARTKARANIVKACGTLVPADLGSPCAPAAADFGATADCALDLHAETAAAGLKSAYAAACVLAKSVSLGTAVPGLCPL
jgi:hypothetical protein